MMTFHVNTTSLAQVAIALVLATPLTQAQTVRSRTVRLRVIESRLQRYAGGDAQRAETLKTDVC